MKTVGEVSELARVTVRTLHHYDELGLLSPSERSPAGYRLYSYDDLGRLQEILIWRALGFSLADVQSLLDDPSHDRLAALERQRELVECEIGRLAALAAAVDAAIAAARDGTEIEEASMFDGFDPAQYEDEAVSAGAKPRHTGSRRVGRRATVRPSGMRSAASPRRSCTSSPS